MTIKRSTAKIGIVVPLSILLASCCGNVIYFDEKKNAVVSCGCGSIGQMSILNETDSVIKTTWGINREAKEFYFGKVNSNFREDSMVNLQPNTKYLLINYYNGDAAPFHIELTTGPDGQVVDATNRDCK